MKTDGGFERLAQNPRFTDRIISLVFNEAHCISAWGDFRSEYKEVGHLQFVLPKTIPILITSATLPPLVFNDVRSILQLRTENLVVFHQSSDRPNIHICVHRMLSPLGSFADLEFVLHNWKPGDPPLPKFLVFFDDINEAIRACNHLRSLLPPEFRDKIKWFNSDMSNVFKDNEATRFGGGDTWGLFTTDSFGMVS
jgi:superfamily II DNA helicase RecQ